MISDPLRALLFAPAFCCVFWFLMLDVFGKKKSPQTALMLLSILFGIREYLNALCFTPLEPGKIIAYIDIVGQFATLLIYPCIIIYILTLRGKEIKKSLVVLSALPAILVGTGSVYDVTTDLLNTSFYALVIIGQILCIVYAIHTLVHNDYKFGDAWRMLGGKQEMSSINLICVLDSIAQSCGFANDSQLVKKFKELEGKTPREWLSEQTK